MRRISLIALASIVCARLVVAAEQPPASSRPASPVATGNPDASLSVPSIFGTTGVDIYTVSFADMTPWDSGITFTSNTSTGYRWTTGGSVYLVHGLEGIPNGALVTQIVWYYYDNSATNDFTGYFSRFWRDSASGINPGADSFSVLTTTGNPGDTLVFENLNYTLLRRFDINNDGNQEVVSYALFSSTPGFDANVRFSQCRILWMRQVSPAPASSSFGDVSTSDPAFPYIEALAASGITAGCGGGNYCPDGTLTRRQMAVFLAKGLGLHWPAL